MQKVSIGCDIGGTHISSALINAESNSFDSQNYISSSIESKADAETILSGWSRNLKLTLQKLGENELSGIGISMPGPFDYDHGVSLIKGVEKFESLYEMNIRHEFKDRLNLDTDCRIIFRNDAVCFAMGEWFAGAGKGCDRILAITLGTGFGTCFLCEGYQVTGIEGVPDDGFLYHKPWKDGIADEYFSSRGILKRYHEISGRKKDGVLELHLLADKGDRAARQAFHDLGTELGNFLNPFLKSFNTEMLIIGGSISGARQYFFPSMIDAVDLDIEIKRSVLGEHAAILGASRLPLLYEESVS